MSNRTNGKKIRGIDNGWFTETATMWPGQKFSLALEHFSEDAILYHETSEYQDILVFQSAQYGKVLVIDGILQLTERDECTYHEMMVHLPLFSHQNPNTVLIVGGGDGVLLREVLRHKEVQRVTLVEIDPKVIHVSKNYLKLVPANLYEDPRVQVVHADAAQYLKKECNRNKFDIILTDTLDPLGPAEPLYDVEFYEAMYSALRENGIVCAQGENLWIHFNLIADLVECCADIFDYAEYATTCVPSYPCGQIGFVLARKGQARSCSNPVRLPTFQQDLQWYNAQMHQAAFAIPQYAKKQLGMANIWNDNDQPEGDYDDDDEECFFAKCAIQ